MAKAVIDCDNASDLAELEAQIDEALAKVRSCNVTYFHQAQKRMEHAKEQGQHISQRQAARQIAEETGESEEAVRQRVKRGKTEMGQGDPKPGRPTKLQQKREKNLEAEDPVEIHSVSDAMHFAGIAIANLECIPPDDPKRLEAFQRVENWIREAKGD